MIQRRAKSTFRPVLEVLESRSLPAGLTTIATLGDSLTAAYPVGTPHELYGNQSWAQQLEAQDYRRLAIENVAALGATSGDVLNGGQVAAVTQLIAAGKVQYATLIVGANDVISPTFLPQIIGGHTASFVTTVTANIEAALTQLADAADAADVRFGLAVGNIPDVGRTPAMQFQLTQVMGVPAESLPYVLQSISAATIQANEKIEEFAAEHRIPVIDVYGLGELAANAATKPVKVGGKPITNLYSADFFHPNYVGQGLLANTVLEALATAYAPRLQRFSRTDQQILADAGIAHRRGHSYFNVEPFVIFEASHSWQRHGELIEKLRRLFQRQFVFSHS